MTAVSALAREGPWPSFLPQQPDCCIRDAVHTACVGFVKPETGFQVVLMGKVENCRPYNGFLAFMSLTSMKVENVCSLIHSFSDYFMNVILLIIGDTIANEMAQYTVFRFMSKGAVV